MKNGFSWGCLGYLALLGGVLWFLLPPYMSPSEQSVTLNPPVQRTFAFQAVDTMKYSRDPSRAKLGDPPFDQVIERQVADIAATGATHVAIATPYDEEFVPILSRWVEAARRHHLKVWFRGNWSGWEEWFDYPSITRAEHIEKTKQFILAHPDIFEDGDAFSACPECENGGPGDPRLTGDVVGYRQFLIGEYAMMQETFGAIHKEVRADLFSMNGDVAKLIMDKSTTTALGGVVTIDHYVKTPEQLIKDIEAIAKQSGGKVVLGEFGAPIPDIHGNMSEGEQAAWMKKALGLLAQNPSVVGVSYWVGTGGSTQLWDSKGVPREAVAVLTRYYQPDMVYGIVKNEEGIPLADVSMKYSDTVETKTDQEGRFWRVFTPEAVEGMMVSYPGYQVQEVRDFAQDGEVLEIILESEHQSFWKRWQSRTARFFSGN